jgi:hypothetical protein
MSTTRQRPLPPHAAHPRRPTSLYGTGTNGCPYDDSGADYFTHSTPSKAKKRATRGWQRTRNRPAQIGLPAASVSAAYSHASTGTTMLCFVRLVADSIRG